MYWHRYPGTGVPAPVPARHHNNSRHHYVYRGNADATAPPPLAGSPVSPSGKVVLFVLPRQPCHVSSPSVLLSVFIVVCGKEKVSASVFSLVTRDQLFGQESASPLPPFTILVVIVVEGQLQGHRAQGEACPWVALAPRDAWLCREDTGRRDDDRTESVSRVAGVEGGGGHLLLPGGRDPWVGSVATRSGGRCEVVRG